MITGVGRGKGMSNSLYSLDLTGKTTEIASALASDFGVNLIGGRAARLSQAATLPANYLKDKDNLIKALINGSTGKGGYAGDADTVIDKTNLLVPLPGAAALFVPPMSSLAKEFETTANALIASGIPADEARKEALAHCRSLYNTRASFYDTAFPGLMDDSFHRGIANANLKQRFNQQVAGL